jgi:hypothetical protein
MRRVLVALVLLPAALIARGQDNDKPKRPAGPGQYGFLLPGGILGKLDLDAGQRDKLLSALEKFVGAHRKELDSLRKDFVKARTAVEAARKARDKVAFGKAQAELASVNKRAAKYRQALEPKLLEVVTEAQKKRYLALKKSGGGFGPPVVDRAELAKLRPLTEVKEYKGHKGGLYPDGKNERPAAHEVAGVALAKKVRPLGRDGKPAADGKIVLLSVGMSNTSQVFTGFQKVASEDEDKAPAVVLVNGAQGGMTAKRIQDANDGGDGEEYWGEVDSRLKSAGATRAQVQVVWIKQADAGPSQGFPRYAQTLQRELEKIVQLLPKRFPNVKLVYLSSRTYGGFARTKLNPEPYAFESGLSVKWLIEKQLKGERGLNYDSGKGAVTAPWLSWGPYLWAGPTKRADGFYSEEADFAKDGTHHSAAGQRKMGEFLLGFFKTDSTAKPWFVKKS